ncbi:hypothetical protein [Rhodococcus sovatensis]|uniref:SCO6045-like C-terminal domain-containing protein n=1 Tax=Rhodococcus sovatensis TaxID=1805840 RepID=A0ABZ2PPB3_9NOCA
MSDLGSRQSELVRALVAGGPLPIGFDSDALSVASTALVRKRAGAVARHLPIEASMLGDRFGSLFVTWERSHPRSNSAQEAREFLDYLYSIDALPRPARRWWRFIALRR